MRVSRHIAAASAIAVTIGFVGAAAWLVLSAAGARWIADRVVAASNGVVELHDVDGTIGGGLRVGRIVVHGATSSTDVENVTVNAAWAATIAHDRLVLDHLSVARVQVRSTAPPRPEPIQFAMPRLPFAIEIAELAIERLDADGLPQLDNVSLRLHLLYTDAAYAMRDIALETGGYHVDGDLRVEARSDVPVRGALNWRSDEPATAGHIEIDDTLRDATIVVYLDQPLRLDARGRVQLLGRTEPAFDVQARLEQWISPRVAVANATLHVRGTQERFDATGEATVRGVDLPPAQVSADVVGSFDALDITRLNVIAERGRVFVTGRVERMPTLSARLAISLDGLDPALFTAAVSGAISGQLDVVATGTDVNVSVDSLHGELNGAPFEVSGEVAYAEGHWSARDVDVRSGPNRISLSLDRHNDRIGGAGRFDLPDLSTLLPELHGDVAGTIAVYGLVDSAQVNLQGNSRALRYREWSLADAHVEGSIAQTNQGRINLTIGDVSRGDVRIGAVAAKVRGSLTAADAAIGWSMDDRRASMNLSVVRHDNRWDIEVAQGATLALPGRDWRLDRRAVAQVEPAAPAFELTAHCWLASGGAGRVCVDKAQMKDGVIALAGQIDAFPVASLASDIEDLRRMSGTIAGRWDVNSKDGHWRGSAHLATHDFAIVADPTEADAPRLSLPSLVADVALDGNRASVTLVASTAEATLANVALDIGGLDATAPLGGRAKLRIDDLAFIASFTRRIGVSGGALNGDFTIGGTLGAPTFDGALHLTNGRLAFTEPRVDLTSIDLTLALSDTKEWSLRGSAVTGSGRITITGSISEPLRDSRRLRAHVDANDVPAHIPQVDVTLGGAVDLDWRAGATSVKGRVEIPRATLAMSELPEGAVSVSEDVIVVDRTETRPTGMRIEVDLEVALKDHVRFSAFGLETGLTGTLRLRESADGAVQLNGTLTLIGGSYTAFGQKLAIDSGRLTYSGPPADPYVDARATRTVREPTRTVTVGAQIRGPTRAIETTLFSEPSMSEAEALSYLILGRPLSSATASEGNDMMGAAIALGLKGAAPVIKEISGVLGLEELTATGGSSEDLTLVAGRRFSDRIFVRYSYQTFTRMSAVLLELMLSRRLSLEATASDIPAADLIYRVGENN